MPIDQYEGTVTGTRSEAVDGGRERAGVVKAAEAALGGGVPNPVMAGTLARICCIVCAPVSAIDSRSTVIRFDPTG